MAEKKTETKGNFLDNFFHHSPKIIIVIVLVALVSFFVAAAYLIKTTRTDNPVIAEISGAKVHLKDYQDRFKAATFGFSEQQTTQAKSYAKDGILHDLVESKVLDKELAKKGLSVTDADLVAAAKEKFRDFEGHTKEKQANDKVLSAVSAKINVLKSSVTTQREGYILYCRFDRASQDDYQGKQTEADKLRADNRAYAEDVCNKAKARLESGKTDFQTELKNMKVDPVIGAASWKPWNVTFGMGFNSKNFAKITFVPETDIFEQIISAKPGSANAYSTLTIKDTGTEKGKDRMFAILHLDKGRDGETTDFNKWFQSRWNEYKIKTYPERIK